jgi:hypothetical protein
MAPFLYELQKYRFLLIVGGVVGTLFLGKTFLWKAPLELSTLSDARAGADAMVTVSADAGEEIALTLTKPDDTNVTLTTTIKDNGKSKVTLPGADLQTAGTYTLSAQRWYSKSAANEESFEVSAGAPSTSHSRVSFSQNKLENGQSAQMVIFLADDYGNPVSGHSLSVIPSQSSVEVYTSEFATNEKGQMNFSISGSGNGVVSFSIFDSTEGTSILGQPQLAFTGGDQTVALAENGPIASFNVSGLSAETLASQQQSVTVKALDASGFTVVDYTGTIRFSSSDSEAALPDDYSFTADDQGEHTFSLSVKLITPGTATLTVTDTEEITITGIAATEVVTTTSTSTSSSSTTYNTNFETTDFTRTGEFTLISPASGSYSSSTIEVQGEGEYGNTAVIIVNEEEAGRTDIAFDNSFDYTLQDMDDGTYGVYVNVVDATDTVLESSTAEKVLIDTTPPTLNAITSDPSTDIEAASTVTITVLSESKLESAAILFQDQVNTMNETATAGKYQVTLLMPSTAGDYGMDVNLSDSVGNEAQYRDQLTLTVGGDSETTPATEVVTSTAPEVGQVVSVTATGGEEKVALSWETPESSSTIAYYRIYYGPSAESLYAVSETYDSSTHWTIPDLTANQQYYFTVAAVNVEGTEGEQSEVALGIPSLALVDISTPVETTPIITTYETAITETPESGPAENILVGISVAAALAYVLLRKRARA